MPRKGFHRAATVADMAAEETSYSRDGISEFSHRAARGSATARVAARYESALERLIAEQGLDLKHLQFEISIEDNAQRKQKMQRHANIKAAFLLRLQQEKESSSQ